MSASNENTTPKVHPATREVLPDDPMEMHAFEVPGDTELMTRLLIEEYARMGWDLESIMQLAHDPNYQVFHALLQLHGQDELRSHIGKILARTGVIRATTTGTDPEPQWPESRSPESQSPKHELPESERLVQIDIPRPK